MAKIIILINLVIFTIGFASADSACGDWTSYQDEKCFKVFDILTPFSGAAQVCQREWATIGIIRSQEEQFLVVENLKSQSIVDNVWIGIKKNGKSYISTNGNDLKFTNWESGRPLNQSDTDCVELSVDQQGKWVDVKCEKKNAVLCEKWIIENAIQRIRNELAIEFKQNITVNNESQQKEIEELKRNQTSSQNLIDNQRKELDQLKQNPVPIGFIYIQLSGQSEPHTLWPQTEWNNISPKYAGLFFRAEGDKSASFGQIQNEQARSLQLIRRNCNYPDRNGSNICIYEDIIRNQYTITNDFNERAFFTGDDLSAQLGAFGQGLNFRYTTDETHPRNQAIRIWIRIK